MSWVLRTTTVGVEQTAIMGVLNTTPDSFSDGGTHLEVERALAAGLAMVEAGAEIIDVGGESTRPGASPVPPDEELARVIPVVSGLSSAGVNVSIDTRKAEVASAAFEAGAQALNDVSALADPGMGEVLRSWRPGVVLMHMRGDPTTMQDDPTYADVVGEVREFLIERAHLAESWGMAPEQIAIDPGLGFGKTLAHNLALLDATDLLATTGYPVLVGPSRKKFLGVILDEPDPLGRDVGTAAAVVVAIMRGAAVVRVHNVSLIQQAARVADAIVAFE